MKFLTSISDPQTQTREWLVWVTATWRWNQFQQSRVLYFGPIYRARGWWWQRRRDLTRELPPWQVANLRHQFKDELMYHPAGVSRPDWAAFFWSDLDAFLFGFILAGLFLWLLS